MFDVNTIWQKLNGVKISVLAWHPDKDNILAFGTDEGKIGYLDGLSGSSRSVTFCDYKHRGTVYQLCYGPQVADGATTDSSAPGVQAKNLPKVLYSCGDGSVMMHKMDGSKTVNLDDVISVVNGRTERKQPSRSDVMFQPEDYR